jgi:dolichol-phosphate mannosyltransferase
VDVVIGSRYVDGGSISNEWPLKRRIISQGATILGRVLFPDIKDPVSGFFAVRKSVVEHAPLKPKGYKILLEVLGKGNWRTVEEIPYTFNDRAKGASKLKSGTMVEYALQVFDNARYAIITRRGHVWEEWSRAAKYLLVGVSGIIVNEGLLIILVGLGLVVPVASILAIEASRLSNFFGNELWTFKKGTNVLSFWKRFLAHQGVTITGAIVNWLILTGLIVFTTLDYKWANLAAILIAFVWNFTGSRKVTWRKEKELSHGKA